MMKLFKHMILVSALIPLLLAAGCGTAQPAALLSFRPFRIGPDAEEIGFYIDWQNTSKGKTIDSLILSVSGFSDSSQSIQLQEAEGVLPQGHNNRKIIVLNQPGLASVEPDALSLSLHQVNFTDGSFWEAAGTSAALPADVDVETDAGRFPVELKQALFYEELARPSKVAPLHFQSDWINCSELESIIGVTYQIIAKTADGKTIPDMRGNDVSYVSEFYEEPQQWVDPSSKNKIFTESIPTFPAASAFRENGAVRFELSVCRCIDSSGRVWENSDNAVPIQAVLTGKKGYSFLRETPNPSIAALIDRIAREASRTGIELASPAVFIEDESFCVLRYEDVDVRVELSADNEVLPDSVAFVYYSVKQFWDFENYVESVINQMDLLRCCICPAVLTVSGSPELSQALDAYSIEDHFDNPYGQVQINGSSYETFEELSNILDERSNIVLCDVFAMGRELSNPSDGFFWVRESPYHQQVP